MNPPSQQAATDLVRQIYEFTGPPPWLRPLEHVEWFATYEPATGAVRVVAQLMSPDTCRNRYAEGTLDARLFRAGMGAVADATDHLVKTLLRLIGARDECQDLFPLACDVNNGDEEATKVFIDTLLERNIIYGAPRVASKDDITNEERARMDMRVAARYFAREVIAPHIFDGWSRERWPLIEQHCLTTESSWLRDAAVGSIFDTWAG